MSQSLPSSLVNQVYLFYPSSSIHPPGIAVTLPMQRSSAVNNYCNCNSANTIDLVEFADAEIGGGQA